MEKSEFLGTEGRDYCPFLREKSEKVLREIVKTTKPKKVLEIGTFLGYSATAILESDENCQLVTIEKNSENCEFARKNLKNFEPRVQVVCADAADFLKDCKDSFDLIFLDGAKAQYHAYFPQLKRLLNVNGTLVCDDVLFYGLVQGDGFVKHKHRTIAQRLRLFLSELQNDSDFETKIFEFEDGLSVSKKIR